MSKKKLYSLTEEHRAQLKPWADKWIANAMSTKPMDDNDKSIMRTAIKGLYESAGLKAPPEHRIVFVPSPFVARFAGGFAAAIWYKRNNSKTGVSATNIATRDAIYNVTFDATFDATYNATDDATRSATYNATFDATRIATFDATDAATRSATDDATRSATDDATLAATDDATRSATDTIYDATRSVINAVTAVINNEIDAETYNAIHNKIHNGTYTAEDLAIRNASDKSALESTCIEVHMEVSREINNEATPETTNTVSKTVNNAPRTTLAGATFAATDAATDEATRNATYAATRNATNAATNAATFDATFDATNIATNNATRSATYDATNDATDAATDAATYAATYVATFDATHNATNIATNNATRAATLAVSNAVYDKNSWINVDLKSIAKLSKDLGLGEFGLECAKSAYKLYQGGNFWSSWDSYISFFRHIVKLDLDYSKYDHWEKAAQHGSYRIMHPEFCIISDRPTKLTVDEQNRPHSFDGPYCQWSDGTSLYSIHGVRVPAWICETKKEDFTKEMILGCDDVDYRRCIIQKIGIEKTIELLGAEVVDTYDSSVGGKYELLMIDYTDSGEKRPYLRMTNPSLKGVVHIEGVKAGVKTVKEAIMFRNGLKKFIEPKVIS